MPTRLPSSARRSPYSTGSLKTADSVTVSSAENFAPNSQPEEPSNFSAVSVVSGLLCGSTFWYEPSSAWITWASVVRLAVSRSVTCWPIPRYSRSKYFVPCPGTDGAGWLSTSQVSPGSLVKSTPTNDPNSDRSTDLFLDLVAGEYQTSTRSRLTSGKLTSRSS